MGDGSCTAAQIGAELAKAGLEGSMHAIDIDSGTKVSFGGDELCAAASTGKVPVLVALMRAAGSGEVDLDESVAIGQGTGPRGRPACPS